MGDLKKALFALLVIFFVACALYFTNRSVTPKQATWEDIQDEAEKGGYRIIKTEELWDRYKEDEKRVLLVDTRQEWEYRTGHIKGALNFPMEPTWLSRWKKRGDLEALLGPDKNRLIVFY
ncbi:MAG: rhodanese-like domain-containing protein [Deltaproteobacteria bacterium]|nr:rhodanese-like domain-containing protein [Deltaproteobacteria bacterium]